MMSGLHIIRIITVDFLLAKFLVDILSESIFILPIDHFFLLLLIPNRKQCTVFLIYFYFEIVVFQHSFYFINTGTSGILRYRRCYQRISLIPQGWNIFRMKRQVIVVVIYRQNLTCRFILQTINLVIFFINSHMETNQTRTFPGKRVIDNNFTPFNSYILSQFLQILS